VIWVKAQCVRTRLYFLGRVPHAAAAWTADNAGGQDAVLRR